MIGVAGSMPRMPHDYPLQRPENAGNMIHARAPLRTLKDTVEYHSGAWKAFGEKDFKDFVNRHCSHLVISMTNTIKVNSGGAARYTRFKAMLEMYDVPIVIFGLGVRSPTENLDEAWLPPEAIDLLRYMETRCGPIGVRGEFTKQVFERLAGVTNVVVTGCPSFFSVPNAFKALRKNLSTARPGVHTYATTRFERPEELAQFARTVRDDGIYIETTSAQNHAAHLQAMRRETVEVPDILEPALEEPRRGLSIVRRGRRSGFTRAELEDFYRSRYRLFRNPEDWFTFNREVVSFGYGTRFHVNMATMLAGVPATWITHDTRTREFCDFLSLPNVDLADSADMEPEDFRALADYEPMFEKLPALFDNWADYLDTHGLEYRRPANLL